MTQSITPSITTTETGGGDTVAYNFPSKTQSQTPPMTNVQAATNLTIAYNP